MRCMPAAFCFGAIVLAVSCKQSEELIGGPGVANVVLTCESDGAQIRVVPWRVVMQTRSDSIRWRLVGSSVNQVLISPTDPVSWPFVSPPPIIVPRDGNGIGKNVDPDADAGTYKYKVTGICVRSATVSDTVVLDPDMIIPPPR